MANFEKALIKAIVKALNNHSKNVAHIKANTDVVKPDNVMFSDFTWFVNPNKSLLGKVLGVFANLILIGIPVVNIYFLYRIFNSFFLNVKKNTEPVTEHKVKTKIDRRYKSGTRVVGSRYVTVFKQSFQEPYLELEKDEKGELRNWSIALLVLGTICWFAIPTYWIGAPLGLAISFLKSKKVKKTLTDGIED